LAKIRRFFSLVEPTCIGGENDFDLRAWLQLSQAGSARSL
jgi:hypothetical protein